MNATKQYQTSLATSESIIQTITALVGAVRNPEHICGARLLDVEQKVGSSLSKQLAQHLPVE